MQTTRRLMTAVILIATTMVVSMLVTTPADANTGYYYTSYSGPCPHWSIQDVLDHPDKDWDGDRVSNVDEVYVAGGLNPCVYDSTNFCNQQPQYCYSHVSTDYHHGYYDPCSTHYYSCYDTTYYYDPYHHGTTTYYHDPYYYGTTTYYHDPCSSHYHSCYDTYYYDPYYGYYYVIVPKVTLCSGGNWSWNQVNAYPHDDWDGDGVSNYREAVAGANPCVANTYYYTNSGPLPHVGGPADTTYVPHCPAGYPYYHHGQCYANPVRPWG